MLQKYFEAYMLYSFLFLQLPLHERKIYLTAIPRPQQQSRGQQQFIDRQLQARRQSPQPQQFTNQQQFIREPQVC